MVALTDKPTKEELLALYKKHGSQNKVAQSINRERRTVDGWYWDMKEESKITRWVLGYDMHIRATIYNPYLELFLDFVTQIKPYGVFLGGDVLDLTCVSKYQNGNIKSLEKESLFLDYKVLNEKIQQIRPSTKKIVFLFGNHEDWVRQYIDKAPQSVDGLINIESNIQGVDKFITEYVDHTKNVYRIGNLNLVHGHWTGVSATKKHLVEFLDNVVFGHTHTINSWSMSSRGNKPIAAWNLGCLCESNPGYLKGRLPQWQNGFAVVDFFPDGNFYFQQIRIIDGKFLFEGRIYKIEEEKK